MGALAADKIHEYFVKQMWGVGTLCLVVIICPLLAILSKNAIKSIQVRFQGSTLQLHNENNYLHIRLFLYVQCFMQVFALSVEKKSHDMKKQKKKQEKLILKMLPKVIVERVIQDGTTVAETFESATLYFSSVDGFHNVSRKCRYLNQRFLSHNTQIYHF